MVVVDNQGIPMGSHIDSAVPAEIRLAKIRVHKRGKGRPKTRPDRVIADKGYDSDTLRKRLKRRGITLLSPYLNVFIMMIIGVTLVYLNWKIDS